MRRGLRWGVLPLSVLALAGCGGTSAQENAEQDALHQAEVAYEKIGWPRDLRVVPAELLGRAAVARDMELLAVDGTEVGPPGSAVTLTVRVVGRGVEKEFDIVPDPNPPVVELTRCFLLRYGDPDPGVEPTECPDTRVITYPPLPKDVPAPAEEALRREFAKVPADVDAARRALARLKLDPKVKLDFAADDVAVAVAMREFGPFGERLGCRMLRAEAGQVEIWYVNRAQDQPGEVGCTAPEALGRMGARPPH